MRYKSTQESYSITIRVKIIVETSCCKQIAFVFNKYIFLHYCPVKAGKSVFEIVET